MARPLSEAQARRATRWLVQHFGEPLRKAVEGTPFGVDLLCGVACQETASLWLKFIDRGLAPGDVLARCIGDASGDVPNTSRSAFPRDTAAFRAEYGDDFTEQLIAEANAMRALRGFDPKPWVYKGYGLFQFDLQHVRTDERFFRERRWHDFSECLTRAVAELTRKFRARGELWAAVKAYNGSGPLAEEYMQNVRVFSAWARDEIGRMLAARSAAVSESVAPTPERIRARVPHGGPRVGRVLRPGARPASALFARIAPFAIDRAVHPVIVIGVRQSVGASTRPGLNRRRFADQLFIDAPGAFAAFDANLGPVSRTLRRGRRRRTRVVLHRGVWYVHRFAKKGRSLALRQRLGQVTVMRPGRPDSAETGHFRFDIHNAGDGTSAHERGHTVHPAQWSAFIALAQDQAKRCFGARWQRAVIPYVLLG